MKILNLRFRKVIFKAYSKSEKKKSDKKLRKKKKPTLIIATSSPEIRIRKRKVMQPGHEKNGDLKKNINYRYDSDSSENRIESSGMETCTKSTVDVMNLGGVKDLYR